MKYIFTVGYNLNNFIYNQYVNLFFTVKVIYFNNEKEFDVLYRKIIRSIFNSDFGFETTPVSAKNTGKFFGIIALCGQLSYTFLKPVVLIDAKGYLFPVNLKGKMKIYLTENISSTYNYEENGKKYFKYTMLLSEDEKKEILEFVKMNKKILLKHWILKADSFDLITNLIKGK